MTNRLAGLLPLCLSLLLLCSCRPGAPKGVMSDGKMEAVLLDMHTAQSLAQLKPADSVSYYSRLYRDAVLAKYELKESDFDRSLEWYSRHTDRLSKIYKRLSDRLGSGGGSATATPGDRAGGFTAMSGDTANVWRGAPYVLLSSQAANRFVFDQPADTAFKAGDVLQWRFDMDWYYSEGERSAVAVLAVEYEGDSIATVVQPLSMQGGVLLSLSLAQQRGVKRVRGFVYQRGAWSERPRLLALSNMRLLRVRMRQPASVTPPSAGSRPDSAGRNVNTSVPLVRDSAMELRNGNRRRP